MLLNAPWKSFYVNLPFERLLVTFRKLIRSHAFTPHWLDDAKEVIQSRQGGANSVTCSLAHENPAVDAGRFESHIFLENYLAVSTWILNESSTECLEKYQHFSSAGVRFGSWVNQISGLKSAWWRSVLCLTLLLCNCCYKQSLRNNPRNQTNIFRLNVILTTPRSQSCIIKSFLQG